MLALPRPRHPPTYYGLLLLDLSKLLSGTPTIALTLTLTLPLPITPTLTLTPIPTLTPTLTLTRTRTRTRTPTLTLPLGVPPLLEAALNALYARLPQLDAELQARP